MPKDDYKCTEKRFLQDVKNHKMTVLANNGIDRHIKFVNPDCTFNQWFEIRTWNHNLTVTGDMGTFSFSRIADMFEFFRVSPPGTKNKLHINPQYWAERCTSADRTGLTQYSPEQFIKNVQSWAKDGEATLQDWKEICKNVLVHADDELSAMEHARDFKAESGFRLSDFWEADNRVWTFHYIWICYAIVWGIKQYDEWVNTGAKYVG